MPVLRNVSVSHHSNGLDYRHPILLSHRRVGDFLLTSFLAGQYYCPLISSFVPPGRRLFPFYSVYARTFMCANFPFGIPLSRYSVIPGSRPPVLLAAFSAGAPLLPVQCLAMSRQEAPSSISPASNACFVY